MRILDRIKAKKLEAYINELDNSYEECPKCNANLTLQNGYDNELPYWVCKGCGELLINPAVEGGNIAWICDGCDAMLNIQDGFSENCGTWTCTECGYDNKINKSELYLSTAEYEADKNSPYKGLSDEAVLALSMYSEEYAINKRSDIIVVRSMIDDKLYVKKLLNTYDESVFEYLKEHPIVHMPRICEVFKGDNNLVVIEEYINGSTLLDVLNDGPVEPDRAVYIARQVCKIVKNLHTLDRPIIHRDIKPSNIIISKVGEPYLLDMNVAKWYKSDEVEDTKFLGTQYYAAPEQLGYGFSASSNKSDIYAIGMLLNVMVTGKLPKEEKAPAGLWVIIEKCICLEQDERLTDDELLNALDSYMR